jgi:gliding motility-associated-like protein
LHNDLFRPVTLPEKVKSFKMYIYNRWGQLVYTTNDLGKGWDGTIGGTPAPLGVYTYIVSYGNQTGDSKQKTGTFTLLR